MIAFFGILYVVPLYYQDGRGLSPLASGLSTFPEAIGLMIAAQVVSRRLYPRYGPRRLMFGGMVGISVCAGLMSLSGATTNLWFMRALMFGAGYSIAHVAVSLQAAAFATISPASTGRASMLFNSNRQLGGAIGVAILGTVIAAVGPLHQIDGHSEVNLAAYHAAFLTASGIALGGCGSRPARHPRRRRRIHPAPAPCGTEASGQGLIPPGVPGATRRPRRLP